MSMQVANDLTKGEQNPVDCRVGVYMRRSPNEIPADQDPVSYCRCLFDKKYRSAPGCKNEHFYIDICGRAETAECPQMIRMIQDCMTGKIDCVFAESIMRVAPNMTTTLFWLYFLLHLDPKIEVEIDLTFNTRASAEHRQDIIKATESAVHSNYAKYAKWKEDVLNAVGKLGGYSDGIYV